MMFFTHEQEFTKEKRDSSENTKERRNFHTDWKPEKTLSYLVVLVQF